MYRKKNTHSCFFLNPAIFAIWPACVSRGEEAASALHGQLTPQL